MQYLFVLVLCILSSNLIMINLAFCPSAVNKLENQPVSVVGFSSIQLTATGYFHLDENASLF